MDFESYRLSGNASIITGEVPGPHSRRLLETLTKDYKEHLSARLTVAAAQKTKEKTYWLNKLAGKPGKTTFPYDHKKIGTGAEQREQTFAQEIFKLPGEVFSRLLGMSGESDRNIHMILVAAMCTLLMRYTHNHDIIIGTTIVKPVYTAEDAKLINTILALRNQVDEQMTFKELILEVKQSALEAEENRNYPFEILLHQLDLTEIKNESPLFGIAVLVENIHERRYFRTIKPEMILCFSRNPGYGEVTWYYQPHLYKKTTIQRIISHYTTLLSDALFNVHLELREINMLSPREKRQILFEFNNTREDINRDKCYHQVFEEQVTINPGKKAAVHNFVQITYRALNEEANPITYFLMEKGVEANNIVAIYMKRGLPMLASIIGIFKAGGAYLAIEVDFPAERVINILQDSEVKILITAGESYGLIRELKEKQRLSHLQTILCLDQGKPATQTHPLEKYPQTNPALYFSPDNIAYLIYTSGTTGKPKGVMIHQLGMLNHIYANTGFLAITEKDIIAQTASPGFDISVWQFLTAITLGGITYIIDKEIIPEPLRLVGVLGRGKITILEIVPSLMSVLLEMIEQYDPRQLKYLRWLIPTGEALSASLAREWYGHYPLLKLVNAYGPAEASDDVTLGVVDETLLEKQETILIGKALPNLHIYIMEPNLLLCPVHVVGEICIAGIGVGKGYLNDPVKTAGVFAQNPYWREIGGNDYSILYRTGDMGYFTGEGNIGFIGRRDHQVKIRGFRIELEEIEKRLNIMEEVKEAVVIAKESQIGDKYLCGYVVLFKTGELSASTLRERLSSYLPDYMVPSYFVLLDKIPLTPNGKIDRKKLPEPRIKPENAFIAPRNEPEKKLAAIWSEILNLEKETISIAANFFELGGHSLKAAILVSKIHKVFDVKVPLVEIFKRPIIKELAKFINDKTKEYYISIEPAEEKDYYPLSSAQKRLYILQQMNPAGTVYNMPDIIPLPAEFDPGKIDETFNKLIKSHDSLRTSFHMFNDSPVQVVHQEVEFETTDYTDYTEKNYKLQNTNYKQMVETQNFAPLPTINTNTIIKNFIRPFDLSRAPLLRVGLLKTGESSHHLLVDMHHIISDGVSENVLVKDFLALHKGDELLPLRVQYKDFSEWQNGEKENENIKRQEKYWLKEYEGEIPLLNLPLDYERPGEINFGGDSVDFTINTSLTKKVKKIPGQHEITVMMFLFSVYGILLARYAGQEELVLGTVAAGRQHADLENIIGFFVNMLPIRISPHKDKTFLEFLLEVKKKTINAFENQGYQFEELVGKLKLKRQPGRHPLVEVVFAYQEVGEVREEFSGDWRRSLNGMQVNTTRFDLMLHASDSGGTIQIRLQYSTSLFKKSTMEEFTKFYLDILEQVVENHNIKLKDIELNLNLLHADSPIPREDEEDWEL